MEPTHDYIRMCKDADELQGHWYPEVGDPVSTIESDEYQGTLIRTNDNNFTAQKTDRFGKVFYGAICNRQLTRQYYVWLPRVDQLQDYTRKNPDAMFDRFREFYSKMTAQNVSLKAQYRRLWLMFVMWDSHQKVWTGKHWIRIDHYTTRTRFVTENMETYRFLN